MCGITGYVGKRPAVATSIQNLKRLEYRGYDSAGVAYPRNGHIEIVKAAGKIVNLDAQISERSCGATVAVAHTRWATHGRPNEANAHPHKDCSGTIAVVHNGIVENYASLRERLKAAGHEFSSETDTEVIAHLIEEHLKDDGRWSTRGSANDLAISQSDQSNKSYRSHESHHSHRTSDPTPNA